MDKKETEILEGGNDSRIYEAGFHIVPIVAENDLGVRVTAIRDVIEGAGGKIIADEYPKHLELSYPMWKVASHKRSVYHSSYFGWMKFEAEPAAVRQIEAALKADEFIIRFIVVKTVRENTMVPKKVLMQKRSEDGTPKVEEKVEEKPVLTEEELDKTIEDLVIS